MYKRIGKTVFIKTLHGFGPTWVEVIVVYDYTFGYVIQHKQLSNLAVIEADDITEEDFNAAYERVSKKLEELKNK